MHEFNLIEEYFTWVDTPEDVAIAVGDDATVLDIPKNKQLVTSIDTLISGVHFPENTKPFSIGYKALAVNLSDIAAMGATPKWFTLALTLPEIDTVWLEGFSAGLKTIAKQYGCFLVGGDTTRGPLSISIQVLGLVDTNQALLRSGAKLGDKIYVTGTLGDAAVGLKNIQGVVSLSSKDSDYCQQRLNQPMPRLIESNVIKHFASSCIDVSDGLLQDLSHILKASKVGAMLDESLLPLSSALKNMKRESANDYASDGGDDYELLFTIPIDKEHQFLEAIHNIKSAKTTCIGIITKYKDQSEQQIVNKTGLVLTSTGYNHFHVE